MNLYLVGAGPTLCGSSHPCSYYFTGNTNIVDPDTYYSRPSDDTKGCFGDRVGGSPQTCTAAPVYYDDTPITQNTIQVPAMTCMLYEPLYEDATNGSYQGSTATDGDWTLSQGHFNGPTGAADELLHWYSAQTPNLARHAGNTLNNYLFCDGHMKARQPEPEGYDITQHPTDNIWLTHLGRDGNAAELTGSTPN